MSGDTIGADDYRELVASQTRRKYNNRPTVVDGIRFDSAAEARRYGELVWQRDAGMITGLECQPRYRLEVNGRLICTYVGDFRYVGSDGLLVVEDVKSGPTKTRVYRIKQQLMLACHGVEIVEVMG